MRLFAVLGLALLASQPAAALTCEEVRGYVQTYGASVVLTYAKKIGATPAQIREGRACLRSAPTGEFRSASREQTAEQWGRAGGSDTFTAAYP